MTATLFLLCFFTSCLTGLLIVSTRRYHDKVSADLTEGVQKFHDGLVPRVGGVALICGVMSFQFWGHGSILIQQTFIALIPIFLLGFWEDLFKSVSSSIRLLGSLFSAFLVVKLTGYNLSTSGFFGIDKVISADFIWILITVFALAALSNGLNIIDGFNGLAIGSAISMSLGISILAWTVNDSLVFEMSLVFVAALSGLLILNFPFGLIFLGDAGAYTCGLVLGAMGIILVERNDSVTPLVLLAVFAYPIIELLFSISRKTIRVGHRPDRPDKVHLHMLVYRSFAKRISTSRLMRNSVTGAIMNLYSFSGLLFISFSANSRASALIYFLLSLMVYLCVYRRVSLNRQYKRS